MQGSDPASFLIEYGSGVVAGSVAYDTMRVGEPVITVQNQGIGLADATTDAFIAASCDGLFVCPSTPHHCIMHLFSWFSSCKDTSPEVSVPRQSPSQRLLRQVTAELEDVSVTS